MFNLLKRGRKRKALVEEIKKEFPKEEKQDPLINNEIELLHRGLDEGNNIWVRDFLLSKSEFSRAELAIIDNKSGNKEATDAKARALALYDRWIKL